MGPHVNVITLGVDDLESSLKFYRDGLGLATEGIIGTEFDHGAVVFFDLNATLKLALYPKASIELDTGLPARKSNPTDFTVGHNVSTSDEVDAVIGEAERAGARIVDRPSTKAWGGYSGHFLDLDNHLWEIVFNPEWIPNE